MKILSISIAAYNVEDYLEETLKSFCIPEIMDDIEVLVIDDGSIDNTYAIAGRFQTKYPNTFRYIQKENGGHGSTVNKGIELAAGKYFKVVDGDDWVDYNEFIKLIGYLKSCDADMLLTDYSRIYADGSRKKEEYFKRFEPNREYSIIGMPEIKGVAMHSIAVKSSILKKNNVKLTEHCFYVDIEYVVYILNFINTVVYLPFNVYMYRYGTPNQSVNIHNMIKNIGMRIKVSAGLARYITNYKNTYNYNQKRYELMKSKVVRMICGTCLVYLAYNDIKLAKKELVDYENSIKAISEELFKASGKNAKISLMRICGHRLFSIENKLYHILKL